MHSYMLFIGCCAADALCDAVLLDFSDPWFVALQEVRLRRCLFELCMHDCGWPVTLASKLPCTEPVRFAAVSDVHICLDTCYRSRQIDSEEPPYVQSTGQNVHTCTATIPGVTFTGNR